MRERPQSCPEAAVRDHRRAVLGWWSLFNLPRDALPGVLTEFRTALAPGGQVLIGTHAGDGELIRTEAYGGVPVSWTTYLWQADQLAQLLTDAGFQLVADVRFPAQPPSRSQVLLAAQRTA